MKQLYPRRLSALAVLSFPLVLGLTALAPAGAGVAAAQSDGGKLVLQLHGGSMAQFQLSNMTLTSNQLTVTLADNASSFALADLGSHATDIPMIMLQSPGCDLRLDDGRVVGIMFPNANAPATTVMMTVHGSPGATCASSTGTTAPALDWNRVVNTGDPTDPNQVR